MKNYFCREEAGLVDQSVEILKNGFAVPKHLLFG